MRAMTRRACLRASVSIIAMAWSADGALAETDHVILDRLFSELKAATTPEEASRKAVAIQKLWMETKSPTLTLLMNRAMKALAEDEVPLAIELLSRVIAEKPDLVEAWNQRATAFYILGDIPRSLADVAETLKREPRHFGALSGLGMIMMDQGRMTQARTAFEKALALYPLLKSAREAIDLIDKSQQASPL